MDFVYSIFFDTICLFVLSTILMIALSFFYLKIRKRSVKPIRDKLIYVFFLNGFVRMYLENLLDGILYALVNLRSLKFVDFVDGFSYLFMSAFIVFSIFFTVFIVIYTKTTLIQKWSESIKEFLMETNSKKSGILVYHLVFILRRLVLSVNAILLGIFLPNVHISIHVVCQLVVLAII
mmetsp:Transcript_15435/g.17896  ORF Transcript_15435/g.17896 Transcript_15435/m.17896 type:complete len:178 (+) Transcript_15435:32-565(+)